MNNSDLEVLEFAHNWLESGYAVELVTLVKCWGSAPRPVGSMAAIREDGAIVGSVSGGCIEKELTSLLRKDGGTSLIQHEISSDQAIRYGLPCGGSLELIFEHLADSSQIKEIISLLQNRERICRRVELSTGTATLVALSNDEKFSFDGEVANKIFGPSWRILIIGAGELSRYVAEMATALDYDVIVCEPRDHFSKIWKVKSVPIDPSLPDDAVKKLASDYQSAVLALTHDPNLDDLAITQALNSDAFYVGALGSKKNSERRRKRLLDMFDVTADDLDRLHGPIGLDIGSKTPAEIAVSILAQLTEIRRKSESELPG